MNSDNAFTLQANNEVLVKFKIEVQQLVNVPSAFAKEGDSIKVVF